jgi:hypothetical protein
MGKTGIFCFLFLLFLFTGCKDLFHPEESSPTSSNGNGSNKSTIAGTWEGVIGGQLARVVITSSGWTMSANNSIIDRGTYVMNGISAELRSTDYNNIITGTAVLLDSDIISITLNSNSFFPGSYTLYRQD